MSQLNKLEILQRDDNQIILDIKELKLNKYNIIYGNNGSGKTSFSRFFNNIKKCSKDNSNDFLSKNYQVIRFNDKDYSLDQLRSEFENETKSLAIFNSDYIEKNVFIISSDSKKSSKSIVILGEDMNEELKNKGALEKQKKDLEEKSWYKNEYKEITTKIDKGINKKLSDFAEEVRVKFGLKSHEFIKTNLEKNLKEENRDLDLISSHDDFYEKLNNFKSYQQNPKLRIDLISNTELPKIFNDELIDKIKSILAQQVQGKTLNELKNNADLLAWFIKGYNLHEEHKNNQECKYCKQEIPENRLLEIKNHFESNITETQTKCENLLKDCEKILANVNNFVSQFGLKINSSDNLEDKFKLKLCNTFKYDICRAELQNWCDNFYNLYSKIESKLNDKNNKPFEIYDLNFDISSIVNSLSENIQKINDEVINNHNDFIGKIEITKENLIRYMVFHLTSPDNPKTIEQNLNDEAQELEDYLNLIEKDLNLIKENLNFKTLTISNRQIKIKSIQDFIKKSSQINKEIKNLTDKIIYSINSELNRIDSELKYIKKGLDEMNKIIKRIVGDKFKLTESDDGYSVDRQKKCLSTLSEGEKTILAIAHFFSNLKSKEYQHTHTSGKLIDKNLTLIIDDPISSLDETNIYMICGYIWEFLKNNNRKIKQFIFLTHRFSVGKNFTMILDIYRKISKKNNKIGDSENQADLFIIKNGSIKKSDKFKDFFYDEYRHLFKQVIDWKNNLSTVDRNNKYIIGNVCRKVLEAFSYFKIGNNYDKLCIEYEGQIDSAISKTTGNSLNIHSHLRYNIFEDLDEDTAKQFPEYVCEIIKAIDENHYKSFESKIDREAI